MPSPRRLFLILLSLPVLFLFFLYLSAHPTISDLLSTTAHSSELPDEIFGLLHFVTSPDEANRTVVAREDGVSELTPENGLQLGSAIVPEEPVEMTWYALGSTAKLARPKGLEASPRGWEERLRALREEYPLIVFSKSYCRYSRRAKKLLEMYDLSPAPKIIEVDLRPDSTHIKTLLTRLTQRTTFPNVILHGRSLGGSDDLIQLHEEDRLQHLLEEGGLKVNWIGDGGDYYFL